MGRGQLKTNHNTQQPLLASKKPPSVQLARGSHRAGVSVWKKLEPTDPTVSLNYPSLSVPAVLDALRRWRKSTTSAVLPQGDMAFSLMELNTV